MPSLEPHVGESQEHIAFRLFELIMGAEKLKKGGELDRKWVLETYAQCLATVKHPEKPPNYAGLAAALKSP
jgi:hypothetical protein